MRILVIRRDNIGDLVCTTPLFAALRRKFPQAWIGAWVNSYNAAVLEGNRDVDEVIAYTKLKHLDRSEGALSALAKRISALWRLRRMKLDFVVLATSDFSPKLLRLARALGAKRVVGFSDGSAAARGLDLSVPIAALTGLHEVERVFRLAPLFGIDGPPPALKVVADSSELQRASAAFPAGAGRKVAVHISARRPAQRWSAERFAELIRMIGAGGASRVLLLWSPGTQDDPRHPGDDEKAREIVERVGDASLLRPYPTETLPELIGALAACDAVICSDGGASHLAAALGKPIVCFFGDSPVERWHPWGVPHRILQPASRRVSDISADEAMAAFGSLVK